MKTSHCNITPLLAVIFYLTSGCASTNNVTLSPYGDIAEIKLQNNQEFTLELIAVMDTSLIASFVSVSQMPGAVSVLNPLYEIPFSQIQHLEVQGYTNNKWVTSTIMFGVLPAIVLSAAAISYSGSDGSGGVGVLFFPLILSTTAFAAGAPKAPTLQNGFDPQEAADFQKYARYPTDVIIEHLPRMLAMRGQERLERLN